MNGQIGDWMSGRGFKLNKLQCVQTKQTLNIINSEEMYIIVL